MKPTGVYQKRQKKLKDKQEKRKYIRFIKLPNVFWKTPSQQLLICNIIGIMIVLSAVTIIHTCICTKNTN